MDRVSDIVTVDAAEFASIFTIENVDENIFVAINGMTLTNATSADNGGAIYNSESLKLTNVVISNSKAVNGGGIYNASSSEIIIVDDEPVVIYSTGELILQNSTLYNNTATNGGAIYSQGRFYAEGLTLANNTAGQGSAIYIDGQGTDIETGEGLTSTALYNATVALNTADTGGYALYRTGLGDSLNLNSSLFVGNFDGTNYNNNINGSYTSTNNYIGSVSAGDTTTGFFTDATPTDHGGWAPTLALNAANATVADEIIDQGANDGTTIYDARGYMRNGIHDIGAYEYRGLIAFNKDRPQYGYSTISEINTDIFGNGSIQRAIKSGETIEFVGTRILMDQTLGYDADEVGINLDMNFIGNGQDVTVLDASIIVNPDASDARVLLINNNDSDTIISVRAYELGMQNSSIGGNGGAIWTSENLILQNVAIHTFTAVEGGAIYNDGAYVSINRSNIYSNTAGSGGAIYNNVGGVRIIESTVYANYAVNGGAIYSYDDGTRNAVITVESSTFHHNTATSTGGAVYAAGKN